MWQDEKLALTEKSITPQQQAGENSGVYDVCLRRSFPTEKFCLDC